MKSPSLGARALSQRRTVLLTCSFFLIRRRKPCARNRLANSSGRYSVTARRSSGRYSVTARSSSGRYSVTAHNLPTLELPILDDQPKRCVMLIPSANHPHVRRPSDDFVTFFKPAQRVSNNAPPEIALARGFFRCAFTQSRHRVCVQPQVLIYEKGGREFTKEHMMIPFAYTLLDVSLLPARHRVTVLCLAFCTRAR